ncbi:MAG: hypothetical protein HC887_00020 [Desulfobacteraceae bacterium]|nr:hypothetical protein [Desulfobacteraceae bacterium]
MTKPYKLLREKMSPEARKKSQAMTDRMLKESAEILTDPLKAAAYLNEALDTGDTEIFLSVIRDIANARKLKKQESGKDYLLSDLPHILSAMGLRFTAENMPFSSIV